MITTKYTNLLKTVDILCEKSEWLISRLLEDKEGLLKDRAFGLWICQDYRWRCIVMDENIGVDEQNEPSCCDVSAGYHLRHVVAVFFA